MFRLALTAANIHQKREADVSAGASARLPVGAVAPVGELLPEELLGDHELAVGLGPLLPAVKEVSG